MKPRLGLSALLHSRSDAVRMVAFLASGALLGKILGFVRELLMARVFGASLIADSFRGAATAVIMPLIPMQNEGVPAVMIPMHRAWQEQGKAPEYLAALCAGLTAIAASIALAIEAGGSWWVAAIVGRMEPEGQAIALTFVRVMAVWMPASVLLNCLSAAEIATGRSRIAALRPTALNASVMTGIVLYAVTGKLLFLPAAFALSFNVLAIWGVWTLWREGALDPKGLRACTITRVLREFLRRLRPLMAQPLAEQGQVWLERIVASGFAVGTIASIDYARTLTDSAVLLIAQPIGMAVLYKGISANPRAAALSLAGPLLAVTVPASVFLAVFATDVVTLIFARGAFDGTAVMLTGGALRGIAFGLWATTLGMILLRFLNNAGRNGRAALILASAYAANAALNLLAWRVVGPFGQRQHPDRLRRGGAGARAAGGHCGGTRHAASAVAARRAVRPAGGGYGRAVHRDPAGLVRGLDALAGRRGRLPRNYLACRLAVRFRQYRSLARPTRRSTRMKRPEPAGTGEDSVALFQRGRRSIPEAGTSPHMGPRLRGNGAAASKFRPFSLFRVYGANSMSSLTARAAEWQRSAGCMLTFHRAAPATRWADLPNKGFYLNLDYLDNLLGTLKRDGWEIVTVEELTGRLMRGENGSRLVNFSVDDCYRDTFEHVVPLFRRHGVPVTLFVTTGIPDGSMPLAWAGLEFDPGAGVACDLERRGHRSFDAAGQAAMVRQDRRGLGR